MPAIGVRRIDVRTARRLRHRLLRPHQEPSQIVFDGDDEADTAHLGAFADDSLVGIASLMREAPPWDPTTARAWRLRGMATLPEIRGQGYGGALLERCLEHAVNRDADLVWCTARAPAVAFYRRFGFEAVGDVFDVPEIGPHVLMRREVGASATA